IIKGETTVQLRISAVLLRKAGRWDVPYAFLYFCVLLEGIISQQVVYLFSKVPFFGSTKNSTM
ncbi:hypothetical protein, partial [Dorea sp.]